MPHRGIRTPWCFITHSKILRCVYDGTVAWKHFPHNRPFVRGIHQSPVDSFNKGPVMWNFDVSFDVSLRKLLNKQSRCRRIKIFWCSFDVTVMLPWYLNQSEAIPQKYVYQQPTYRESCYLHQPLPFQCVMALLKYFNFFFSILSQIWL